MVEFSLSIYMTLLNVLANGKQLISQVEMLI